MMLRRWLRQRGQSPSVAIQTTCDEYLAAMTNETHMIRAGRVHVTDRCVHVGSGAKSPREPRVDLVRDANGVRSIRVTCRCGEVLCLELDYASKAA